MNVNEFKVRHGEFAVRGLNALNDEDMAKLAQFLKENFTTGKAFGVLAAVDFIKIEVATT